MESEEDMKIVIRRNPIARRKVFDKNLQLFTELDGAEIFFAILREVGLAHHMPDYSSDSASGPSASLVLGGGCFWCTEAAYRMVPGVIEVVSGYAGGEGPPNYEAVCSGTTGHAEVVRVDFDPAVVTLAALLDLFWKIHDPTTLNRQGADVGTQYRSTIMVSDDSQRAEAEASMERAKSEWGDGIVTEIVDIPEFHVAEDYHQRYFERNPEAGFCQMVIRPKLDKVQQQLANC